MSKIYLILAPILAFQVGCITNPINQAPTNATGIVDQGKIAFPYPKSSVQQAFQRYFTKERSCFQVMDQFSCFDQVPRGVPKTKYNEQLYAIEYLPSSKNQTIVSLKISGENSSSSKLIFDQVSKYLGANYKKNHTHQSQLVDQSSARNISPTSNLPKNNAHSSVDNNTKVTPLIATPPNNYMDKSTKECMNHALLVNQIEFAKCVDNMPSSDKREAVKILNENAKTNLQKQKTANDAMVNSMATSIKGCLAHGDAGDFEEMDSCMNKFKAQHPNPYEKILKE